MHLSRIRVHGFKSFATPAVLHFDPGITAIVGPNGCGKSNVIDAIRWVIGEQRARTLRSDRMNSIIFGGTVRRRALGMAEVQLTVQNTRGILPTEFSEVTLGRRLYRSGDSEYLLNGTLCRLRDIVDLFLDTGMGAGAYSVIEIKMIEDILSESTQDRRRFFEEAAGITKYKQRRAQALRKLESVQTDLGRVQDLTREVAKRVARLKRQARAASRHKVLAERVRTLSIALAALEHSRLTSAAAALEAHLAPLRANLARIKAEVGSQEALLQVRRKAYVDDERAVLQCDDALKEQEARVSSLETALRLERERYAVTQRDIARAGQRRKETEDRQSRLDEALASLRVERTEVQPELRAKVQALEVAEQARDAARAAVEAERTRLGRWSGEHTQLLARKAAHLRRFDKITARIELAASEAERLAGEAESEARELTEGQARVEEARLLRLAAADMLRDASAAAASAAVQHDTLQHQIDAANTAVSTLAQIQAARQAETALLAALISGYEDFPETTKFLAGAVEGLTTLSDVLVADDTHRAALAAALGPLGACIIVPTEADAERAVALLKKESKGRGLFVVLERIPKDIPPPVSRPGLKPLLDLVSVTDSVYQPLARMVLCEVYYADELVALAGGEPPLTRVTAASGEWLDARGFLCAGSEAQDVSAEHMGRRERLNVAEAALTALTARLAEQRQTLHALRQEQAAAALDEHKKALGVARDALADASRKEAQLQRGCERAQQRHARLLERIGMSAQNVQTLSAAASVPQVEADDVSKRLNELSTRISKAQAAVNAVEAEYGTSQDHYASAQLAEQDARNTMARIDRDMVRIEAEYTTAGARTRALVADAGDLEKTLHMLSEEIVGLEGSLSAERARLESIETAAQQARVGHMKTRVAVDRLEQSLRKLRRAHEAATDEERDHAVHYAALTAKKEEVTASVQEQYGVALGDDLIVEEEPEDAMREELAKARERLQGMGIINALAVDEFEKEQERHAFMAAQCEDLSKAEATLLQTAEEINRTAAKRFRETYDAIRDNFRKLFRELFGGDTSGDLQLTDSEDLLESPIAITAQPRGKRPVSIMQLSSGEKTLTAIALLFAIYQVKPSPFCFLDEVDAPLDDANIERFMRLIRRFSLDTQFVLVTHNKRTMEMADRLYGITMQEEGVSRLVGVRLEEAMAVVG